MINFKSEPRIAGIIILFYLSVNIFAQSPQGFSYQAVARDANQDPLANESLIVHFSILNGAEQLIWKEEHSVTTNELGMFNQIICNDDSDKAGGSASTLSDIDWGSSPHSIKVEVDDGGTVVDMGSSPLMAVPYALFALDGISGGGDDADADPNNEIQDLLFSSGQLSISNNASATTINLEAYNEESIGWKRNANQVVYMDGNVGVGTVSPEGRLSVQGVDEAAEEPLFMVRRKDGYPVFAVFEDGVYAYTDTVDSGKGKKGGFAVGGYNQPNKGIGEEYMRITADSIRFYVNPDPNGQGIKGGFAVGGLNQQKKGPGTVNEIFRITPDSVRIYIDSDPTNKGLKGGFAVGGYNQNSKGSSNYFNISGQNKAERIPGENRVVWYPQKNAFMVGNVMVEDESLVGENSIATGYQSQAWGDFSEAFGYQSIAGGNYSTAIGKNATAAAENSVSIGDQSLANAASSFALGTGAVAFGVNSYAIGSSGLDSANNPTVYTKAHGEQSFAIGMGSESTGYGSFAIGTQNQAGGKYSLAMGYSTTADGDYATTIGSGNIATGWYTLVGGRNSQATNHYATSIGRETNASGYNSLALGAYTTASGKNSTAMGDLTIAAGIASTAFGRGPDALGNYSFAAGIHTVASAYASNVFGRYNIIPASFSSEGWTLTDPLFTIGNGSNNSNRKNALLIRKNGETYFPYVYSDAVVAVNRDLYIGFDGKIGYLSSSKRYKRNIKSIKEIDWLYRLRPVSFQYKEDKSNSTKIGLIAEEVETINPDFVSYNSDGIVETVSYSMLVTPMLKAIQDQNDQILEQQSMIDEKEAEIEDLRSRLEKIEKHLKLD